MSLFSFCSQSEKGDTLQGPCSAISHLQTSPTSKAQKNENPLFSFRPPHQSMSSAQVLLPDLRDSKSTLFQDELSLQPLPSRPGFPTLVIPKHTSVATHRAHPRQNAVGATTCSPRIFHNPMSHPAFKPSSSWGSQLPVNLQSPLHNRYALIKEGAFRHTSK